MLAIILVLSNFLLGVFSVYLLRRVDRDYSGLIDDSIPVFRENRALSHENGRVFRGVIGALVTSDPAECAEAIAQTKAALASSEQLRSKILAGDIVRQDPAMAREITESGRAVDKAVRDILQHITPQDTVDAEKTRVELMLTAFDRHSAMSDRLSTVVADRAEEISGHYTDQVRSRSEMVLGLAGWPLLLAASIVVLTVVVVIVMLFVFRQADVVDEP